MSRVAAAVLFVLVLASGGPALADGDVFFGLGFGPGRMTGALAEQFAGGSGLRFRFGFRNRRFGTELGISMGNVDTTRDLDTAMMYAYRPAATFYALDGRTFQLLVRAGLGFGAISGSGMTEVACELVEECVTKPGRQQVSYPGASLDAGLAAQVHLGGGIRHVMLWIDVGTSLTRHQIDGATTTGRTYELTIGIARAFR